MRRAPRVAIGILAYVAVGAFTAWMMTAVLGPDPNGTAFRSSIVGLAWPVVLPFVVFIWAGRE